MVSRGFVLLIVLIALVACNKRDPFPERTDAIYQDIQSELSLVRRNMVDTQALLSEHEANLKKVVPQTGQIRYAQKRLWETRKVMELFQQQEKYWIIREEQRRLYVRRRAIEAHEKGEKWSDPEELREYLAEKKLRQARMQWDVRQRRADFERELEQASKSSESQSKIPASDH